jgi:hypothetical protein
MVMVCDGRAFLPWDRGTMRHETLSLPMFWWHPAMWRTVVALVGERKKGMIDVCLFVG